MESFVIYGNVCQFSMKSRVLRDEKCIGLLLRIGDPLKSVYINSTAELKKKFKALKAFDKCYQTNKIGTCRVVHT